MMEEMFRWLFIGFIAGLWLSLEECESGTDWNSSTVVGVPNSGQFCCKTHSAKTCCVPCLFNDSHPVQSEDKEKTDGAGKKVGRLTPSPQEESGHNQCVCINLHCKITNIADLPKCEGVCLKWNCNHNNCCIVCHKDGPATNTTTTTTTPTMATTTTAKNPTASPSTLTHATNHSRITVNGNTIAASHTNQKPSNAIPPSPSAEESNSPYTNPILLVLLLFVAIVIIIAAVVLFMRKRKFDKRNEWSPTTYTSQGETVTNVYADNGTSGGTAPAGNHIYDELDIMTLDPTPSNVYSTQPTSVAVDMGRSADYVDIDLPMKDQQKPMSTSKATLSLSPVYSQPFESPTSASNTEYAEPFTPGTNNTATAPVLNHSSAAVDQQNDVYSLATAIPLSDVNVIYSQPNKPGKSTGPTGESRGSTDPIHSEATRVEPGAESRGSATQDPNAVYAEPMKQKKS